jgi:hypothetical protein
MTPHKTDPLDRVRSPREFGRLDDMTIEKAWE